MASQALYRKWRSQTFAELVGQQHVVQTLRNAISEDRVAHAYLFTGPRGVGKTSMARLLARAVNCTAPPQQRPCGVCASCQSIADGRAVDVIEMDAASHTSVDDAREIIERVQFRPTSGRYKVYVIDEVHMLSTAAFNALLKTLEEPPEHAIFILATTEIHKVPATILSRCQRFTFSRHTIAQIAEHVQHIAQQEGLSLEPGAAAAIARAATGSMRDALGILEQLGSFASGPISLQQVQSLLGMTAAAEVESVVDALLTNNLPGALRAVNHVANQGADIRQFARDLVECLRALLLLVTTQDRTLLDAGDDELLRLEQWAQQARPGPLVVWIRLLSGLDYQLRTSSYGHLPLELALVEALLPAQSPAAAAAAAPTAAAAPRSSRDLPARARPAAPAPPPPPAPPQAAATPPPAAAAPAEQPPTAETHAEPAAADESQTAAAAPPVPETPAPAELQETLQAVNAELILMNQVEAVWPNVMRDVRSKNNKLAAILRDVHPVNVEGNTIVLHATSHFHYTQVAEKPRSRQLIESVLSTHLGGAFAIRCIYKEQEKQEDAHRHIQESLKDEHVRVAINTFEAEIIDFLPAEQ